MEVLTVGHSTHPLEELIALLHGAGVESLADVRLPWLAPTALVQRGQPARLPSRRRHRVPPPAGARGRRKPVRDSPNSGWRVAQFQGYADHMESDEFERGLSRLLALAANNRTAVMCAEAQWWRCHRRLLADALLVRGHQVMHLDSRGKLESHALTEFAVVEDGRLRYPPQQGSLAI